MSKRVKWSDQHRFKQPYVRAAEHKEGYLSRKWDRTHPGWRGNKPKVEAQVTQIKRRRTAQ